MTKIVSSMRHVKVGSVSEESQRFDYEIVLETLGSHLTRNVVADTVKHDLPHDPQNLSLLM